MKLFVDDERAAPEGWTLAMTVGEAVELLETGQVEEISLDYMIEDSFTETFEPVARYIARMAREKRPRRVIIHTLSFSGALEMMHILRGKVPELLHRPDF